MIRFLMTQFVSSPKWVFRQAYILLAEQLIVDRSLSEDLFVENFFDKLIALASDKVPNVRLALSRCLARTMSSSGKLPA